MEILENSQYYKYEKVTIDGTQVYDIVNRLKFFHFSPQLDLKIHLSLKMRKYLAFFSWAPFIEIINIMQHRKVRKFYKIVFNVFIGLSIFYFWSNKLHLNLNPIT